MKERWSLNKEGNEFEKRKEESKMNENVNNNNTKNKKKGIKCNKDKLNRKNSKSRKHI